jgi:alkylhydroperoxidase family enzyme
VLTSDAATSSRALRQQVFDHAAALTRGAAPPELPPAMTPYFKKVALHPYKVLDREIEAIQAAGSSVEEVFELTVVAAVSAGVTRLEMALAALEEVADAPAD